MMTEKRGIQVDLNNEGRLMAIHPSGEVREILPRYPKKKGKGEEEKKLPKDILLQMRTVMREVFEEVNPDEAFGIGQFAEHLVDIDTEVPEAMEGRENDILTNACARAMGLGFSAEESARQVLFSFEGFRTQMMMGDIGKEQYSEILGRTTGAITGYYPRHSRNWKK